MDSKYEWNLTDIYNSNEEMEQDVNKLLQVQNELVGFKGNLANGSNVVLDCFRKMCEALGLEEKLYSYAMLTYHKDMSKQDSIKLNKRMEKIVTDYATETAFIIPELSKIDEDVLRKYLEENQELQEFKKSILDIIKSKKHILSQDVEQALSRYSEVFGVSENAYEIFTNTEFDFPDIVDKDGNKLKVTHGTFSNYLLDNDESIRKQAFESMYSLYKRHENSIAELYLSKVKLSTISASMRNYSSSLEAATDNDDSNVKVVETLIEEVDKNLGLNHEYIEWKKKALNKDEFHMYDVYLNPLNQEKINIEYEDGKKLVLNALAPMGDSYTQMIAKAMNENWIDVFETPNKRSGGYATGVYGVHPYVLVNYLNTSRDVSTVAHELGHAMHFYYANDTQNVINANYTIMVAEVASTVNEILLANYLINNEQDSQKKAALINEQLDTIRATLYRQVMFAEFEKQIHNLVEAGEGLSAQNLDEIYFDLVKKYFGNSIILDEEIKYEWARIPHFYSPFYVYKYATGITSAIVIATNILEGKEGYVERYINMLKQGGSMDSLSLLRMVDVDLEKPETYEKAFSYFRRNLEELKGLTQ